MSCPIVPVATQPPAPLVGETARLVNYRAVLATGTTNSNLRVYPSSTILTQDFRMTATSITGGALYVTNHTDLCVWQHQPHFAGTSLLWETYDCTPLAYNSTGWCRDWTVANERYVHAPQVAAMTADQRTAYRAAETVWTRWNGEFYEPLQSAAMTEDEQREWRRRNEERLERARLAKERAKHLFVRWLTPEQRQQFERHGTVRVRAQSGRQYEIDVREVAGRHGNITELNERGQPVARLCCAPHGADLPHFDAMVGQKIALELDEYEFRRTANFTPLVAGYRREVA